MFGIGSDPSGPPLEGSGAVVERGPEPIWGPAGGACEVNGAGAAQAVRLASGVWPAGQRVQAIPSVVTWPAGQARHEPPPGAGTWPVGQDWQAVEPRGAIWPGGQAGQAVAPSLAENRPAGQNWQTGEPAPWNMPAGQMAQDTPSATGVEPGGQARHIRSFAATMPRGQAVQVGLLAPGATRPAAHGRHSVERCGAN